MKRLTLIGLLIALCPLMAQNISMVEDYSPSSPVEFLVGETVTIAEITFDVGAEGGYAFVSAGGNLKLGPKTIIWIEVNGDSIPSTMLTEYTGALGENTTYSYSSSLVVNVSGHTTIQVKGCQLTSNPNFTNTYQSFRLQVLIFETNGGGISEAPSTNPINSLPTLFCSSNNVPSSVQVFDMNGRVVEPEANLPSAVYVAKHESGETQKIVVTE